MLITLHDAARMLSGADDILILCHRYPDGDTLGSAYALARALQGLGKRAAVDGSHEPGKRYRFLRELITPQTFEPRFAVSVDVASASLLGEPMLSRWGDRVELSLDHHRTGQPFAKCTFTDPSAAAAAEIVFRLLPLLGAPLDAGIAAALYTGVSTDTGGFRFPNTTPETLRIAAALMEAGADAARLNRLLLDTKSRGFLELERRVLGAMRFFLGGRCAVCVLPRETLDRCGVTDDEADAVPPMTRQIEGVLAGVTLREKENGDFRVSVRTQPGVDAARICRRFGGGGHSEAAGCTIHREDAPDAEEAVRRLVRAVKDALPQDDVTKEECE